MLEHELIIEYWQDANGRFLGQARGLPIHVSGETLADLRADAAEQIRAAFRGSTIPSVYDLVPREPLVRPACGDDTAGLPA